MTRDNGFEKATRTRKDHGRDFRRPWSFSLPVRLTSGGAAAPGRSCDLYDLTFMDRAFVVVPLPAWTSTVNFEVAAFFGLPEMTPADDSLRPFGSL